MDDLPFAGSWTPTDSANRSMGKIVTHPLMNASSNKSNVPKRKRSMTSIALSWLSDRIQRADEVKHALSSGTYKVSTTRVAKSIVDPDEKEGHESA